VLTYDEYHSGPVKWQAMAINAWIIMKTATFRITTSYGNIRCYPVDATAKLLCDLSGFKTLLPNTLTIMEDLGFTCVNEINDSTITPSQLY
jgi:hypothetical protein